MNIIVCVKQVMDPETPASAFAIDSDARRVVPAPGIPPVVNGFDENAVEAALKIKDAGEAKITVISVGNGFVMDVMKKPLSMGADENIASAQKGVNAARQRTSVARLRHRAMACPRPHIRNSVIRTLVSWVTIIE